MAKPDKNILQTKHLVSAKGQESIISNYTGGKRVKCLDGKNKLLK
jgi:hypothetical protein